MIKKKPPPAGAPEWVLTYGDMMSLLLCFFILLAAFADYEEGAGSTKNFEAAIESIHEALGVSTPGGRQLDPRVEFNTIIQKLKWAIERRDERTRADTNEVGPRGKNFRMRRIRDGMEITIGGPVIFEPFSAELAPEGRAMLQDISDAVRGHRNKIEIRGHAAEEPRPADWTWDDAVNLSFQRARRAADELIARGLDPRAIRIVAAGANEPVKPGLYSSPDLAMNRRVEIVVRESLVDDYVGQSPSTAAPTTRPQGLAAAP